MKKSSKKRSKKEKNENYRILFLLLRYISMIIFAIPRLYIFYLVLTPLTVYPIYFLLKIFYVASLAGKTIMINGLSIELVNACIAGSAFYLLFILNMSMRMKIKKRFFSLVFSFSLLWIINIIRIFLLSILYIENFRFFDITHVLFWYGLSIIFVVGVWFLTVKIFKIKGVPIYSDLKYIYSKAKK